jgi:diguanylate cyclase (GGDEF)-like protein
MQVSYIRKDRYLVTFHNISRIIAEKNTISKIAEMDELTQVYNRAKFKSLLETALQNVKIHNTTFSLVIADIDHFKKINDTYGHNAGDKVLIQFTSLIRGLLRSRDAFARWGGEEFVILSESTNSKEAYLLAERLRKDIESFSFDIPDKVTCSFGVSEYMTGDTPLSIVKRADDALYKAKESGRNTVCN